MFLNKYNRQDLVVCDASRDIVPMCTEGGKDMIYYGKIAITMIVLKTRTVLNKLLKKYVNQMYTANDLSVFGDRGRGYEWEND